MERWGNDTRIEGRWRRLWFLTSCLRNGEMMSRVDVIYKSFVRIESSFKVLQS
jgi:hypothetical protein